MLYHSHTYLHHENFIHFAIDRKVVLNRLPTRYIRRGKMDPLLFCTLSTIFSFPTATWGSAAFSTWLRLSVFFTAVGACWCLICASNLPDSSTHLTAPDASVSNKINSALFCLFKDTQHHEICVRWNLEQYPSSGPFCWVQYILEHWQLGMEISSPLVIQDGSHDHCLTPPISYF